MGRPPVDELVAIADGRTTVEDIRASKNESSKAAQARTRAAAKASTNQWTSSQPTDSVGKNVKQVVKSVMGRPVADELQAVIQLETISN